MWVTSGLGRKGAGATIFIVDHCSKLRSSVQRALVRSMCSQTTPWPYAMRNRGHSIYIDIWVYCRAFDGFLKTALSSDIHLQRACR